MKKEFIYAMIITFIFLTIGTLLLHFDWIEYGVSFFILLPFIVGYVLGKSSFKRVSLWGLFFSLTMFIAFLISSKLEGLVCVLMSFPLMILSMGIGIWVKYLVTKYRNKDKEGNLLKSTIVPFLIFLTVSLIEKQLTEKQVFIENVKTEIILPYSPLEVYNKIKSVDTLDAEKPFLMKLDLPIPQKCVLEEEKVGGIRTCYFQGGKIVERITVIEKGKELRMDVIDYQLTGRKWLGFKEAIYLFEELENGHTKMTRITTYTSELYPRSYWRPLEKLGIEQEHQYVFRNLIKDLNPL